MRIEACVVYVAIGLLIATEFVHTKLVFGLQISIACICNSYTMYDVFFFYKASSMSA